MPRVTRFGVLPILRNIGSTLTPLRVVHAFSAEEATRKADVFASVVGGAVVFSKAGDPDLDQWEAARIISRHGEVPAGIEVAPK
ncbi:hypothetical protein SAMN05444161_8663 [Rhizobiales bacterium GAS191]|nr:hypothetical protein SAMN05519104_8160 [Rhizobiales bacterium GAS188]SEF11966.1 hypothetical protein SAMN05444161_8663 [Rhizobiales bacterium GAS191]